MLKDKINEKFDKLSKDKDKNMSEDMGMEFKGKLEIWAIKDGKVIHHDDGSNIVTKWAKHATMHLLTSESYSTHGDRIINGYAASAKRTATGHSTSANNDGTMISGEQYLSDNVGYYDNQGSGDDYNYWSVPHPDLSTDVSDSADGFIYPFFPTKMLFGTGIEYDSWASIPAVNQDASQAGYANPSNGGWGSTSFNLYLNNSILSSNYYSDNWTDYDLNPCRTLNDVYSAALDTTLEDDAFAIKGAIKDGTYNGSNEEEVLTEVDGNWFSDGSYRGIGQPAFIYSKRAARYMNDGEAALELGETVGTTDLDSKITYTVVMPEQPDGEFYPYNGYTLKVAGLYADAAMLLKNTVPADATAGENDDSDETNQEFINYKKMPNGILWATRNIAPIFKSHDTKIVAQWTIYL